MIYIDIKKPIKLCCKICGTDCKCEHLDVYIKEKPIFYLCNQVEQQIKSTTWLKEYTENHKELKIEITALFPQAKIIIMKPLLKSMLFNNKLNNLIKWKISLK